jgi:hypothetical protein
MNSGGAKYWPGARDKLAEKLSNKLAAGALLYSDTRVYLVKAGKRESGFRVQRERRVQLTL